MAADESVQPPEFKVIERSSLVDPKHTMYIPVTTSSELRRWTRSIGAKSMSSSYDLYDDVTGCYSYDFPDTNDQYVFVGAHHSTIVNLKEPHEEKKPPQWRDRTLSGNMAGFCQNGLHAKGANYAPNSLPYGPGAYTTARPAVGNLAASFLICHNLRFLSSHRAIEKDDPRKLGVLAMTMFLPLNDVIGLMKLEVKAIRDGLWKDSNGISQPSWGPKAEGIRKDLMKQKAEREGWGIDDRTVVVAVKKGEGMVIEEMTWAQGTARNARFIGEVVDKPSLKDYAIFRNLHQKKFNSDPERSLDRQVWANRAIPALEKIPETRVWKELKDFMFDLRQLPAQPDGYLPKMELWRAYDEADERDY